MLPNILEARFNVFKTRGLLPVGFGSEAQHILTTAIPQPGALSGQNPRTTGGAIRRFECRKALFELKGKTLAKNSNGIDWVCETFGGRVE